MARQAGKTTEKVQSSKEQKSETKKSKDFLIRQKDGTSLFVIGYEDGGQVPAELAGMFTSPDVAKAAIQNYQDNR